MKIKIPNARLSFPDLFQTGMFGGEDTGKYSATFILDKVEHAEQIKVIQAEINRMMKEELKGRIPADKVALKDGDETGRPEYEGKMTIKASTKRRPLVLDRDRSPLTEEDQRIYAGCYVHGIISLWAQNNQYGKRINASLEGVMFAKDGEPFGDGGISASAFAEFADFDGEDDIQF